MSTAAPGRSVVVGVDGTSAALNAARWAAYLAVSLNLSLTMLHSRTLPEYRFAEEELHSTELLAPGRPESADGIVKQAVDLVHTSVDDLVVRTETTYGSADSVLVELSRRARFVVLGSRAPTRAALLGRTTSHVVIHAHCPVVVWRGIAGRPIPRHLPVVVGMDGTSLCEPAAGCARELAAAFGVPLIAVHVRAPDLQSVHRIGQKAPSPPPEREAGVQHRFPHVAVTEQVIYGSPVPALVQAARTAQLLVVGSRGRGSTAAALLGSTSRGLLHRAPCPVLVCRRDA